MALCSLSLARKGQIASMALNRGSDVSAEELMVIKSVYLKRQDRFAGFHVELRRL